jgi:hypothetical protein
MTIYPGRQKSASVFSTARVLSKRTTRPLRTMVRDPGKDALEAEMMVHPTPANHGPRPGQRRAGSGYDGPPDPCEPWPATRAVAGGRPEAGGRSRGEPEKRLILAPRHPQPVVTWASDGG